jgi:hypothetical protein
MLRVRTYRTGHLVPATKIQDEAEVRRWFEEGRTYAYMAEQYRRKYQIETVPSMWGNFRRRRGLPRRTVQDDVLNPWAVAEEHRWQRPVQMLRFEARRRAGYELEKREQRVLNEWIRVLKDSDEVIDYDEMAGFTRVPRRVGIDLDLIHEPDAETGKRRKFE